MQIYTVKDLEEFQSVAQKFTRTLQGGDVVALSGVLGAGKTTFVQTVAQALGIEKNVTSPTFTIIKMYHLPPETEKKTKATQLCHIDAYRLEGSNAADFVEYIGDPETICFIEWSEYVDVVLLQHAKKVTITVGANDMREVEIKK